MSILDVTNMRKRKMQFLLLWVVLLEMVSECQRLGAKKSSNFCVCDNPAGLLLILQKLMAFIR